MSRIGQVLHLCVRGAPTGVVVLDPSEDVILSNPAAHALGLVHERTPHRRVRDTALRVLDTGEPQTVNLVIPARRAGAADTCVRCAVAPLTVADDRFVVLYGTDESELVRMESARRDFVANVSHELKTPVGALGLLVEALVQAKGDPEAVARFGASLTREADRLSAMITELIALSKLQGAEAPPDLEELPVRRIIEEAVHRARGPAEDAGIALTWDCAADLRVRGDRALLVTAVANLISNAVNYSPGATPVTIGCTRPDPETIAIRVTDRGIGISLADQERIFERFFRVDKARSRATGGTGLGLAIVKHVAANHGGAVKVWSRPGTGSTFTIELPAPREEGHPQ
ncbi:sensor histidine kinase [Corynebacterium sphenisci]|uniref:sensor histidine kinase n=1 Tax=Corynebacterium sphenisci TaxID=191493 RepID=UPI0026DF41B3|nr:ATP-binding protein [Corynebacterium sphenisci]MDO5732105.1 ATP-binding protein [Corynebacterium sphenisci]